MPSSQGNWWCGVKVYRWIPVSGDAVIVPCAGHCALSSYNMTARSEAHTSVETLTNLSAACFAVIPEVIEQPPWPLSRKMFYNQC